MNVLELWNRLAIAPHDARVVLQLPDGNDVEVSDMRHHCQLVVVSAQVPWPEPLDNSGNIEEAMSQFPDEDFLETIVKSIRAEKFPPRMDEFKNALIETLLEIQSEQARASEYGRDELRNALKQICQ